jgi:hypothetical protein
LIYRLSHMCSANRLRAFRPSHPRPTSDSRCSCKFFVTAVARTPFERSTTFQKETKSRFCWLVPCSQVKSLKRLPAYRRRRDPSQQDREFVQQLGFTTDYGTRFYLKDQSKSLSRVTNSGFHMMVQLTLHRLGHHHTIYAVTAAVCNNDSLESQPSHSTVTDSASCLLYLHAQR